MKGMGAVILCWVLCTAIAITGCNALTDAPADVDSNLAESAVIQESAFGAAIQKQLAEARAATAKYHRYELAGPDGYILPPDSHCAESLMGGMGWHYVNFGLMVPPHMLKASEPQVLLYEPQKNGRMKLVAVEWVVPYQIHGSDQPAPTFMGQTFNPNPMQGLWMLHAWIWENNPDGIFADWNPRITCQYASH